jgi:RNA-binding protein
VLTGKQRRFLRALAHHLSAIVQIGKDGLTGPVIAATDGALAHHELIKVKIGDGAGVDRHGRNELAAALAEATTAEIAGTVGHNILLYRRAVEPKIQLPENKTK